jgi:hypothetical protein
VALVPMMVTVVARLVAVAVTVTVTVTTMTKAIPVAMQHLGILGAWIELEDEGHRPCERDPKMENVLGWKTLCVPMYSNLSILITPQRGA